MPPPRIQPYPCRLVLRGGDERTIVVAPRDGTAAQKAGVFAGDEVIQSTGSVLLFANWNLNRVTHRVEYQVVAGPSRSALSSPASCIAGWQKSPMRARSSFASNFCTARRVNVWNPRSPQQSRRLVRRDAAIRAIVPAERRTDCRARYAQPEQRVGFRQRSSPKFTRTTALLINGGTAAEAEILVAALRDNGRALISSAVEPLAAAGIMSYLPC